MTVSSTINKSGPYSGNGVTVDFEYEFRILDEAHITVVKAVGGVETVLTLAADYSVSGVGALVGGSVVLDAPPATGETITIVPNPPFTQMVDLENQGAYYAETVERALDLAAMRDQQLAERLDRSIQIPVSADASELDELIENVVRLGDSADEIDTVAGIAGDVTAVAGIAADVTAVAGIAADVATVAGVAGSVAAVAANTENINAVAGIEAEIIAVPAQVQAAEDAAAEAAQSAADAALFDPANYLAKAGGALTGRLETAASAVGGAGLNVPHGAAPTAPVDGDIWTLNTGLQFRINGVTRTTMNTNGGTFTGNVVFAAATTGIPSFRAPHGVAPSAPTNGDVWSTSAGWFVRTNGVTQKLATEADIVVPDYATGNAALGVGTKGTYAQLRQSSTAARAPGYTTSGANLRYSNAAGLAGDTPSGTWRLMGELSATGSADNTSTWLRIS